MAKMNYAKFKEDDCEVISTESVEIIPNNTYYDLSERPANGQALANAVSPVAAFTDCINTALNVVTTISKCVAVVSIEKQRTEQYKAFMKTKIEESKQQTKRVEIHEREETKRLYMTCETEMKIKKLELEKLRDEYKSKRAERKFAHKEFVLQLDTLDRHVADLIKDKDLIRNAILEESDSAHIEIYFHALN